MIELFVKMLLAYLIGSVSGSLLLGKFKKVDIRQIGSGNAGGTNAYRTQGKWFGLGVLIIDIGKGILAAWWVPALILLGSNTEISQDIVVLACGFAAVVGHCYPIWHGFRGGKGAATAVGALIVIEPWLLLPVIITWVVVLVVTGYVGLATLLVSFSLVPVVWFTGNTLLLVYVALMALFLLFTHRNNVRKMCNGTEHQFQTRQSFNRKG